jgi:hypothetical protein
MLKIIIEDQMNDVKREFQSYLKDPIPDNIEIDVISFWLSYRKSYPLLSKVAINYLTISLGSLDAERSLNKFHDVNTIRRNQLDNESLKINSWFYFPIVSSTAAYNNTCFSC